MRKIGALIVLLFGVPAAWAASEFSPFTSVEQAQLYCPPFNKLTFTPNKATVPNSPGAITGNSHTAFESIPLKMAIQPKNIDGNGFIANVTFRSAEGLYGYISNNVVTCLYSYISFKNKEIPLVLRGK